jgi:hypothetical protein
MFDHYDIMVDVDDEPLFVREFEALIPKRDRYYDRDLEIYMVVAAHLETVKRLACDYFERVLFHDGKEEQVLKKGSDDLTVPQAEVKENEDIQHSE